MFKKILPHTGVNNENINFNGQSSLHKANCFAADICTLCGTSLATAATSMEEVTNQLAVHTTSCVHRRKLGMIKKILKRLCNVPFVLP